jgi:hypothetical protein
MTQSLVVKRWLLLLGTAIVASAAPRTIEIPALSIGENRWSAIKLTNPSAVTRRATVDVYRQNGAKMAVGGEVSLKPSETIELRIGEEVAKAHEMCWARITDASSDVSGLAPLEVTAVVEVLRGNSIESFDRRPLQASPNTKWLSPSWAVQEKDLYFLNASDKAVEVSFCTTDSRVTASCPRTTKHYPVAPNQAVVLAVGKLRHPYFLTASSARGRAVLVLLSVAEGARKVFSSESQIQFGEPAER